MTVQLRFSSAIAFFLIFLFCELIVMFCILEGLKGDSAVCVYPYSSWNVIIDM